MSAEFSVSVILHPVIPEAQSPLVRLYGAGDSDPQETVPSGGLILSEKLPWCSANLRSDVRLHLTARALQT